MATAKQPIFPNHNRCYFQNNILICSRHNQEVCGICCSDYALFNKLRSNQKHKDSAIRKEIKLYFKKPKRISKFRANNVKSPELQSLLTVLNKEQKAHYMELVALCGYLCFTARFVPEGRIRLQNILQLTLNTKPAEIEFIKQIKNEKAIHDMTNKQNKLKRKQKMKQKQIKKQNELKKRGIHSRIKNIESTYCEIDIGQNYSTIYLLLAENGCIEFGSFFREFNDCVITSNDAMNELQNGAFNEFNVRKQDDMIVLSDSQRNTLRDSSQFLQFALKYGTNIPYDDPQKWDNQQIMQFLSKNNISLKPQPSKDVLVQVVVELIEIKYKMMNMLINMPDDDEAQKIGKKIMNTQQKMDDFAEEISDDDELGVFNYVIDAQRIHSNPFTLKTWCYSVGGMFSVIRSASLLCSQITTKPFMSMQETFVVIANSIDKYDCIQKVPMFVAQDGEQTRALNIVVIEVKEAHSLPLVLVKYFVGMRGMQAVTLRNMMAEMNKSQLMQEIPCDLDELKLITRLFQKNRKKLLKNVVQQTEKRWAKGWHLSAFMPYKKGEKKCPSCHKLATLRCARCKNVAYCSRKCQKIDWKSHKIICKDNL